MAIKRRGGLSLLCAVAATAATLLFPASSLVEGQLQSTYDSSNTYYDRYLLDSPYNLCRDPLMARANITATTEASHEWNYFSGGDCVVRSTSNATLLH